jgi:uncharacterized protein (TIGR02145 family)
MNTKRKGFFIAALAMLSFLVNLHANNIQVSNAKLVMQNTSAGVNNPANYTMVQFDLSWENSWRTDDLNGDGVNHWDAAWVFVKYRISSGEWQHAYLNDAGHSGGTGTGATIDAGLLDPGSLFHATTNPGLGVFIYRSANGAGTFSIDGAQLRWNYGANGVADDAIIEIKVFVIEMVYIPQGEFYLGSGGVESAAFYNYPETTNPYQVTGENAITVGTGSDNLYYPSTFYGGDQSGPVPEAFPKGYAGFYCQKYEITQQQYVDFLNTLTQTQANNRKYTGSANHYAITGSTVGSYTTSNPYRACNYLSWMDGLAYADWAGLRPMTELEYEKACRGTATPVANEYAWGTASVAINAYTLSNPGAVDESIATNYSTTDGNAMYEETRGTIVGPLRVGIFATVSSTRSEAGSSYYGIMELSGNLVERTVTVGNADGRAFTGVHGNGVLSINGHADVAAWPGLTGNPGEVLDAVGSGYRGGSWENHVSGLRVSQRLSAAQAWNGVGGGLGFRAVRLASEPPGQPSAIEGPVDPCNLFTGIVYSVTPQPNVTYTWSVPNGWSITAGNGTHEITVTAGTTAGNIEVVPFNIWGAGPARTLAVSTQGCFPSEYVHCDLANPTAIVDVTNPVTGRTWMDRNLGASQQATSSNDAVSYGDLYQWGRGPDGHQCRNSATTTARSATDQPGHGSFILASNSPTDWRDPQNANLWQGVIGVNNPCPTGYRLPTEEELNDERESWSSNNAAGAFASPLKWPLASYRHNSTGEINTGGPYGYYWSTTVDGTLSRFLYIFGNGASINSNYRAIGCSVRCIKDY